MFLTFKQIVFGSLAMVVLYTIFQRALDAFGFTLTDANGEISWARTLFRSAIYIMAGTAIFVVAGRWLNRHWLVLALALILPACTDVAPSMTGTTVFDANGFPTCVPSGYTCEVGVNAPAPPVRY